MKQRLQGMVAGIAIGAVLASGIAYATTGMKTIEVEYDNIKVYKDNVLCELKDSNGSTVEPFIYNGTTFLPVRASANLADMEVTWDGANSSVYLWDNLVANGTYLLDVCTPYEKDRYGEYLPASGNSFSMAGSRYGNGFTLDCNGAYALFNLNSKYSNIEFTIGHVDGSDKGDDNVVQFYVDGKLVKEVSVGGEELPKTVSIPVSYGLQLKIIRANDMGPARSCLGFANVTVK